MIHFLVKLILQLFPYQHQQYPKHSCYIFISYHILSNSLQRIENHYSTHLIPVLPLTIADCIEKLLDS